MSEKQRQEDLQAAAAAWDRNFAAKRPPIWLWWENPQVAAYLGDLVCGEACSGTAELAERGIRAHCGDALPFETAISVGCGSAYKEVLLLERGVVRHFTLYDISKVALARARKRAEDAGVAEAITFVCEDAFRSERGKFDMVYWDNSLHHMLDVYGAIAWSKARLKPGGRLVVNDYVGPSRFQWPEEMLARINGIIEPMGVVPTQRVDEQLMKKADPSEAADSARTKEALFKYFPNALWTPLGGAIYHVALIGKPVTVHPEILSRLLRIDAQLNASGMYVYAWATAVKEQ